MQKGNLLFAVAKIHIAWILTSRMKRRKANNVLWLTVLYFAQRVFKKILQ